MKRKEITEELVRKIGAGIREFNRSSPPQSIYFANGRQLPPTATDKERADEQWHNAIRYALLNVAED